MVQGQPKQIVEERPPPPISKITRAKWIGGVAQVELCRLETLSSTPVPQKEEEKEEEQEK
jgi:hypothetical protein